MKIFKQILLITAVVIGISVSAQAQQDGKKTPPKDKPPVIVIKGKNDKDKPKDERPRDGKDNKGKKPEMFFLNFFGRN
jgi:hypothetical protein